MPKEILVYKGWIGAKESDRAELEKLGVEVIGCWNPIGTFDFCSIPSNVFPAFERRWKGRGVWGMVGRKQLVYSQAEMDEDIPF
jgi:hypothetical protein